MVRIQKKWLILVIVDILICTAILLGTSYFQSSKVLTHRMEEETQLRAEAYAQDLGGWMKGYARVVEALTAELVQNHVIYKSSDEIHRYLKDNLSIINADDEIADIYYTDINDHMICGSEFADQGTFDYTHEREWFVNAAASENLCYSHPYMDSMENRIVMTLSKSVRENDQLKGVFCADIYIDTLTKKVNEAALDNDSYAFLVDSNFDMVVHPSNEFKFDGEPVQMDSIKSADYSVLKEHLEKGKTDIHYIVDYDGEERGFATAMIPEMNWYVGIAIPRATMLKDISSMSMVFLAAGLAALVIGVVIIIVFAWRFIKTRQVSSGEALKKFGWKRILLSVAAVVFFVALIVGYLVMLYNSSKDTIMARGELHSVESANSLNRYISQGTSIVRQTQYELDKMMDEGATEREIQDYMVYNTDTIQHTLDQNYTGLYGYINGRYYDGANWVPDEGWVATERPWYKKAIAADGKIALIEPYIDAQTGLMTMTVAMAMNDRKNVVAIDVAFSMMKAVTQETADNSDKIEMVLDANGAVIAHSDDDEIGKNYLEEKDTLGAAVAAELYTSYDQCFELSFGGIDYVAYCVNVNNEWYSLTLINSEDSYQPLRILIIVTIFIIILTVVILAIIFINISSKSLAVEKLNVQLTAASDIYVSSHDINMLNDTFVNIHTSPRVMEFLKDEGKSARETIYNVIGAATMIDTRNSMLEFADLDTLDERMAGKNTIAQEFHVKDGRWMRGRFIVSERTSDGKLSHVLWMVESIDEEKRQRDELQYMSARAIAESEAKSAFLSNMSHEIRTPITAVLGMNEMVLRECTDDNILNYAESIDAAGHTLLGLINDILDFSKIEAGKMEIIPVEYDLSSVLNDLVNMTQIRVEEKGLLLNLEFDKDMPTMLYGDEVRIKQIITNILTNAVKYTEKGEVTFSMWGKKHPSNPDYITMCAEVRDTGIGIREEDMNKLFTRFDRIEEQRNRNIEGTGLGMTITKRLLDLMEGTMEVESEYGSGSTFRVSIRQKVVDWTPIGDYEESFRKHVEDRDHYRQIFTAPEASVLVVDDTQMNLMVFKSLLKSTEVKIETAKSGDDGLARMAEKKFDVIFLDHMMPGKDGIQTLKELKENTTGPNIDTPIICLTANAISGAREMYMKEGFDNYMTKPIDSVRLEEMLVSYIPEEKVCYVMQEEDKKPRKKKREDVTMETVMGSDSPDAGGDGAPAGQGAAVSTEESGPIEISPLYRPHAGINLVGAMEGMGGEEAFRPILDIFYETIDENSDEIEELYRDENWEDYTILVHALKSSSRIVGAIDLGEEAFQMEMAGKERNLEYIHANHETLMTHYRDFKDILSDIYEESGAAADGDGKPEASHITVAGWCERIRAGAEDMDITMLEDVFHELEEYSLSADDAKLMKELKHLAESFDYDTILEKLG